LLVAQAADLENLLSITIIAGFARSIARSSFAVNALPGHTLFSSKASRGADVRLRMTNRTKCGRGFRGPIVTSH
jgi:hypothetical protein